MFTMNLIHWIFSTCFLSCFIGCSCSDPVVHGFEGEAVTLPCRYDWRHHGVCEVCWMRGSIPLQSCGDQILSTNGNQVVTRANARYQLQGQIQRGDVSLTILNARQSDSGKYGCRVEVPGLFNDKKYTLELVITEAPTPTPTQQRPTDPTTAADFTSRGVTTLLTSTSPRKITETSAATLTPEEEASSLPSITESTTILPTTELSEQHSPSLQTSSETETSDLLYSGTTQASVNSENYTTESELKDQRAVDESRDFVHPAIVGSVLVLVVVGLVAVCLMWKQRRRFWTKLQLDMESGVELTRNGTPNVNGETEDELQE